MSIRKFFDDLQIRCHMLGLHRLGSFLGRWGTPKLPAPPNVHERDTLPDLSEVEPEVLDPNRMGPGWALDEPAPRHLVVVTFDPTFNDNRHVDYDLLALPHDRLSVN